jgi:hypothetical protein
MMNSVQNYHTHSNKTHNRRSKEKQVIIDMVKAKVSFPVMAHLTGISKPKFTQLQQQLNIPEHEIDQHEPPNETKQQLIWSTWNHNDSVDDTYRLLANYSSTSFKITAILAVIDRIETNTAGIP